MKINLKTFNSEVKDFYQKISVDKHQVSDAQSNYLVVINNLKKQIVWD